MADILDTRYLQTRLEELESELKSLQDAINEAQEELNECENEEDQEALADALNEAAAELEDWEEDNHEELDELNALSDDVPNWGSGNQLINEDYFIRYAIDLADDIYGTGSQGWPFYHIDWDAAADALKMDYSACEYQGETYYFRG